MVEAFAFGGAVPQTQNAGEKPDLPAPATPFTLAKMIGISSMAPAQVLAEASRLTRSAIEKEKYWPVASPQFPAGADMKYAFSDGGTVDNSGLLPLIQRGVKRVVWFAHSYMGTTESFDVFDFSKGATPSNVFEFGIIESLLDKFGYAKSEPAFFVEENKVFREEDLWPILEKLQDLKRDGKPGVLRSTLLVLDNSKWGIVESLEEIMLNWSWSIWTRSRILKGHFRRIRRMSWQREKRDRFRTSHILQPLG